MSFLGGALEKHDAPARVKLALLRDLELRRKDDRLAERFPNGRYYYQGGADLILRHGEFWPGRVRPAQYEGLAGEAGKCFLNSLEGAKANGTLTYVEGYCTADTGRPFVHGWCVDNEGVVDLSLPCGEGQIGVYVHHDTKLPFLTPDRWGYYGVRFTTVLVAEHMKISLPMLDRSYGEMVEHLDDETYAEHHDFPILKAPYDPNRTELP